MDKTTTYPIAAGIMIYALIIILAYIQRDITVQQLILIFATPILIGVLSKGVKKGLMHGFLVPFVMVTVEIIVLYPGIFAELNIAIAAVLMMALPIALMSAALGAIGGLLGKHILKNGSKIKKNT